MSPQPTHRHLARTLAGAAAFAVAATGAVAAAPTASAATVAKTVALKAAHYPRLVDRPGADDDVIRFTYVPGAAWKLDGAPVQFDSGKSTEDVEVTAASAATLEPVTGDALYTWNVKLGTPSTWNFPKPTEVEAPKIDPTSVTAIWNDVPGTKDKVVLKKVDGVVWTVKTGTTETTYDAGKFGKKTELTVPVTKDTTLTVAADLGYSFDGTAPTFTNPVTDTATVAVKDEVLKAAADVGDNPHDSIKGYGPGAALESVKVTGVSGVKWKVGSKKAVAVKGIAYLPVDPDDITEAGTVDVTVEATKGYTVPAGYKETLDFKDGEDIVSIPVVDGDVKLADLGGTSKDLLTLKTDNRMVWWVGQEVKQKDGSSKVVYKALKPGKKTAVTYKPRFTKGETTAKVYLKPVPNRGYTVDTESFNMTTVDFTSDTTIVPLVNQGVLDGTKVTYAPHAGVTSWATKYVVKATTPTRKDSNKSLTVKPADIEALGAESMVIDFGADSAPTVTPKYVKDHTGETATPTGP